MSQIQSLNKYLQARLVEIMRAKKQGKKVIGYTPGEYVPHELIHASGCNPICLIRGGDPEPVALSGAYVPRYLCAFSRAQLGYKLSNEDLWYQIIDRLITAVTCQHIRRMGDMWSFYTDIKEFRFGVPRNYTFDEALNYYHEGLNELKKYLEELIGKKIDDDMIWESIRKFNQIRQRFRNICQFRKEDQPRITARDYIFLHHASFYLDPDVMLDLLDTVINKLGSEKEKKSERRRPRVMLMGPNLAMGDYKILELLENARVDIVAEEFCEGIRYYWSDISEDDSDPLLALSKYYYHEKLPCGYMISAIKTRYEHLIRLAEEFHIDGLIWYHLKYCETYSLEGFYIMKKFQEKGIPTLKISSEYDIAERGQLKTNIETFVDMLKD